MEKPENRKPNQSLMHTSKSSIEKWQPENALVNLSDVRKLPDIFTVKTPSLARLKREMGEEYTQDYLARWIILINKMVNVGNKMNAMQVKYTAQLIISENPLLTIADIKYVFDRAISGQYGELYNRLDSSVICKWFRQHWDERLEAGAAQSEVEHQQRKSWEQGGERTSETEKVKFREAFSKHYKQTHGKPSTGSQKTSGGDKAPE